MLVMWFSEPEVARWWHPPTDIEEVRSKYLPRIDGLDATTMWIVEIETQPAGLLQTYRHADYPTHDQAVGIENAAGIDYLLAGSHRGRGYGGPVLQKFAVFVLDHYRDLVCCVATPAQTNTPSLRALERAGFSRVHDCQPPGEPRAYAYAYPRNEEN